MKKVEELSGDEMEQNNIEKNIFKRSRMFRLIIVLMAISNVIYVAIEIYKSKISEPLLGKSEITKLEYYELENLSNYSSTFEAIFIILAIIGTSLAFTGKYKPLLKSYIVIQLTFLISICSANAILAWIFDAPSGNMTQLVMGPFLLIFGTLIYFVIKNTYRILIVKRI
ncbi:hypothetical protein [Sporosarcina sp. A2]|uniref:hypothetical protein n=1 Tax=Sporosarcina sp. A2 TaxID=3393449 RepID=UPI003D7C002E